MLDNTLLSNFASVRRVDLVLQLWGEAVYTTPAAFAEYEAGVAGGLLPKDAWVGLSILTLSDEETAFAANPRTCGALYVGHDFAKQPITPTLTICRR